MKLKSFREGLSAWNNRLVRYVKDRQYEETMALFERMQRKGVNPDKFTFIPVLNACSRLGALEEGRRVHALLTAGGYKANVYVDNSLLDMYCKCGSIADASRVFTAMEARSVVSWNAMIRGYVKCGQGQKGLELYRQMAAEGMKPDPVTFVAVLNAAASLATLDEGRRVHAAIIQRGFGSDLVLSNALVDMYSKCGSLSDALKVFNTMSVRDVVSWNSIITGYVKCGQGLKALELSREMQRSAVKPDRVAYVGLLNACASEGELEEGRLVHKQIIKRGLEMDLFVASSLVDMYAKCGSIENARKVFDKMSARNVVAWTAMIIGYVKLGQGQKALDLSWQMQQEGVKPNQVTFAGMLNACAIVPSLEEGRRIHQLIIESGFQLDTFVHSGLVDMYAKCGSIVDAQRLFNQIPNGDLVAWNAMLSGYSMHGQSKEAIEHFEMMHNKGITMDGITFVSLLSACSHGGLVEEGLHYFGSMSSSYGVSPTVDHYACLVSLLARAGHLHEAEDLINRMSCDPDTSVWISLLGACSVQGNMEMGERVAKRVVQLEPGNASSYVLLSNLYAGASKGANSERGRLKMVKTPECTWIEVNKTVHSFKEDDREHPRIEEIYRELMRLFRQIKAFGFNLDTRFLGDNVKEERHKEGHLFNHSEKLAIAYGLISTPHDTPLHISQNLGVCTDRHTAIKFITKVVGREIILRDASRFHQFQNGICSCRDYW